MANDLRIEPELEVSSHDKWLDNAKKINQKFRGLQTSNPSQPENSDIKSVYNGDIHPRYQTTQCKNCSKYTKWLGSVKN